MSRRRDAGANEKKKGRGAGRARPPGARPLGPGELRWRCDPAALAAVLRRDAREAAAEERALVKALPDARRRERAWRRSRLRSRPPLRLTEIVGQERAIEAIASGLGTEAPGFHVFVCGPPGSGRESLVRAALARFVPPLPPPRDCVYVANFSRPDRPRLLTLPRGKGRRFRRDLDDALALLRRAIPAVLNQEVHLARCGRLRRRHEERAVRVIEDLAAELRRGGLIVGPIPDGFSTPELRIDAGDGEPLPAAVLERRLAEGALRGTARLRERLRRHAAASELLEQAAGAARSLARRGTLAVRRLDAKAARNVAQGFADDLARAYPTRSVRRWLDSFLEEVGERVDLFLEPPPRPGEPPPGGDGGPPPGGEERRPENDPLELFRANLFVDATERPAPPVLFEPNPTYPNLFGSQEAADPGAPEHARLRAGSLVQANGGVIVVDAPELFKDETAWRALKRTVKSGWLEVQRLAVAPGGVLRPEPMRTAFKLVAIGDAETYDTLWDLDPDFPDVFKVKVQVEDQLRRTARTVADLARALLRTARRAGLLRPDGHALARLVEHAARMAERNDRLAPRFAELVDVLQEADRLARARGGPGGARARGRARRAAPEPAGRRVTGEDVERTLRQRVARHDIYERRVQELIDDGVLLLEVTGARVGVVNALVVHDSGDHAFSRPTRVTAAVGVGRHGVVDVERRARLSGAHHLKGVEIVAGLLRERYAQSRPLCLTATICFEQSYAEIDGDSASLAELLAVLSALGDLPLAQGIGVTGSINQKGEVQAIGDVNRKVEGFFDVCRARRLTGRQGVLIPAANVRDLMLRPDVVEAVAAGRFFVTAVSTLEAALELASGVPAGARPAPGAPYPAGTANARVEARLAAYAQAAHRFEREGADETPEPHHVARRR